MIITKDYSGLIAQSLKTVRDSYDKNWDPNLFRACDDHVKQLAYEFKKIDPDFDRKKFIDDCGASFNVLNF